MDLDKQTGTAKKATVLVKTNQLSDVVNQIREKLEMPSPQEVSKGVETPQPSSKIMVIADNLDRNIAKLQKILIKIEML